MSYDIRKPQISDTTPQGQISQIKSYLIQLAGELGFALNDIAKGNGGASVSDAPKTSSASATSGLEARFVAFQSQIIGGSIADTMTLGKRLTGTEAEPVDLDEQKTPGCYYSPDGAFIVNNPTAKGFRLEVKLTEGDEKILQTLYYGGAMVARYFDGSKWSAWLQFASSAATVGDEPSALSADFVTERGKKDGWTYRKWNGGTYEMFGIFEVTPASSEIGGTLYRSNDIQIPTPFPITGDAVVTGMGSGDFWLTNGVYANDNAISIRIMCDKAISTADTIAVSLHVIGTYAQNGG